MKTLAKPKPIKAAQAMSAGGEARQSANKMSPAALTPCPAASRRLLLNLCVNAVQPMTPANCPAVTANNSVGTRSGRCTT